MSYVNTLEVNLSVAVSVKDVDDSTQNRIVLNVWNGHELIDTQAARLVLVKTLKAFGQSMNLLRCNCGSPDKIG